jgi:predicted SnoaL-like aldol condensation-catalyzing enzyme
MKFGIFKLFLNRTLIGFTALVLGACQNTKDPQAKIEAENLEKAVYCMDLLENKQDLVASRLECFDENYIQHTPRIADGRDAVLDYFANRFETYPEYAMEIKRTSADGDLVWIQLHAKRTPDNPGAAVINIFRMKNGKFIEHWNVGQAVPKESKNNNTMF